MESLERAFVSIAESFSSCFPSRGAHPRTVGREAEFPVVTRTGEAADVRRLWTPLLDNPQLEPVYDRGRMGNEQMIVGLKGDDFTYMLEVGLGTVEVNTRPCHNLFEIEQLMDQAVRQLVRAAATYGWRVLGYGVQPLTAPSLMLMSPKQRYISLYRAMGVEWLWYTVTASDQLHVSLSRSEMIPMLNLGNLLAPVLISLCANSPIYAGRRSQYCSAREGQMAQIRGHEHRHGMPAGPVQDVVDFVKIISASTHLILREESFVLPTSEPFTRFIAAHGPDFDAFLFHEHYVWNSARLRAAYGTIEIRPACQQPWSEHMTLAALALGMIEAAQEINTYVQEALGPDYWDRMRTYHRQTIVHGLAAPEPVPEFLTHILHLMSQGLAHRGFGEETFLSPANNRLYRGENPAQRARRIYRAKQIDALLTHATIRPSVIKA